MASGWRKISAGEIGGYLKAPVEGDAARCIEAIAPLTEADRDTLSWIGDPKYAAALSSTRAAVVLAPPGVDAPVGVTVIRVSDPDLAICDLLALIAPKTSPVAPGVHPSAIVHPQARIAESVAIGPHVCIQEGASIGANTVMHAGVFVGSAAAIGEHCVLWPNVVVRERCRIGNRVVIHPNSTIGADGFGYLFREGRHRKIPQVGIVVIEDDVEIGANAAIDRARSGETRIGTGTKIDNLVQIAHNCRIGPHCVIVAQVGISGSCTIGHHVVLAGQVGVGDHLSIGDGARVGAQAGVLSDMPAGQSYWGTPAAVTRETIRQHMAAKRLPKLLEQLRELTKRIERLESTANDQG